MLASYSVGKKGQRGLFAAAGQRKRYGPDASYRFSKQFQSGSSRKPGCRLFDSLVAKSNRLLGEDLRDGDVGFSRRVFLLSLVCSVLRAAMVMEANLATMSATRSKTDAVGWPVFDPVPYDLEPGPFYS